MFPTGILSKNNESSENEKLTTCKYRLVTETEVTKHLGK